MKRIICTALMLGMVCILPLNLFSAETTLAVLDFENNSFFNPEEYQPLSQGLAQIMITELGSIQALRVVERQQLRSIMDELKLSQSGLISDDATVKVGKMLGAHHLVFGGYMVTMDEKIRIDVRIVQVETGLTVKASEITGKTKNVLSLVKKLSKKVLTDLKISISKNEARHLSEDQSVDMNAMVLFSKAVDLEDHGLYEEAEEVYKRALRIEPSFQQAQDRLERLSEKKSE